MFRVTGDVHCIDGVYRAGFATTQGAYEKAVHEVFEALDKAEKLLTGKDYLVGDMLTEADIRLWVTIVRYSVIDMPFALIGGNRFDLILSM